MRLIISLILAASLLAGCAGTRFSFDNARQVKPGMTSAEVEKLMGKPYSVTAHGPEDIWVYCYVGPAFSTRTVSFILQDNKVTGVPRIPASFK